MYVYKYKDTIINLNRVSSVQMVDVIELNSKSYLIKVNMGRNSIYLTCENIDERMIIFDKIYNMLKD